EELRPDEQLGPWPPTPGDGAVDLAPRRQITVAAVGGAELDSEAARPGERPVLARRLEAWPDPNAPVAAEGRRPPGRDEELQPQAGCELAIGALEDHTVRAQPDVAQSRAVGRRVL